MTRTVKRKPRLWQTLVVVVLLAAALVGCRCISVHYYGIAKARLFRMYDGVRFGMTLQEARDFCLHNKVMGMSVREADDGGVSVSLDPVLTTLGGRRPEGMWALSLDFDGGRLVRARAWDTGGERGSRSKRMGAGGTAICEEEPPRY